MTKKRKKEWQRCVRPNLPDYYLSETIQRVYDYLQVPMLAARYDAFQQEYSPEIASRIGKTRNDLKELQQEIIRQEKADWSSLVED